MKIDWIARRENDASVTLYDNNITLSKVAANYFNDAYKVLVGLDKENNKIIIKKVNKEETLRGDINKSNLHGIAIKSSYARITGKQLIHELTENLSLDFDKKKSYKYNAKWYNAEKMLIVETGEEVN